jgi:hypothetical protein
LIQDRPIGAPLNRDIAKDEGHRPGEEMSAESVRAYNEKRRQMARHEWHAFYCGQAARHRATLQALVEHHEEQAAKLMEDQPKGAA